MINFKNIFHSESRTAKAGKQIIYSFLYKGISMIIGLIYVPLLLNYLTQEKYGIWLTLTSIFGWFSFFDIGLGNGLRNKLTEALARNDLILGKKYISTTYALLICIFSVVLLLFHICNYFLNWNLILNTQSVGSTELYKLAAIVFSFFIIRFIVQIISIIYLSDQKPSINNFISTITNLISLILILLLTHSILKGNLILLGTIISVIPVIVFIVITYIAFNGRYKSLKPSVKLIDFSLSKGLLNLGIKFFFLQITAIIIFSTSSFFISQFYGPKEVVSYNIAFQYFQIPIMVFSIIMSPVWSAVTDAYTKSDFQWLKKTLKRLNIISIIFIFGVIIMVILSKWFFKLWIGENVQIPLNLIFSFAAYTIIQLLIIPYSSFINGLGKIKLTMLFTFLGIAVYLILIFIFGKIFKNSTGIVMAILCTSLIGGFIQPLQTYKILNGKAKGKWNE